MAKNWSYANLSKRAKEAGGVEALINKLVEEGKKLGRKEMIPVAVGVGVISSLGTLALIKINDFLKNKSIDEIEKTKQEITEEIIKLDEANKSNIE